MSLLRHVASWLRGRNREDARLSSRAYTRIFDAASNPMAFTEATSGKLVDVNAAWMRASGLGREQAIGTSALDLGLWPDVGVREACLATLAAEGRLADYEATLIMRSKERTVLLSAEYVDLPGGRHILWDIRDITAAKRAEDALRRSEARLAAVLEAVPDTISLIRSDLTITYANRLFPGQTSEMVVGSGVLKWIPDSDRHVTAEALDAVLRAGEHREYETLGPGPAGGAPRRYRVRLAPFLDAEGAKSAICVATDITERSEVEAAWRDSEQRLRSLFEHTPVGIWVEDFSAVQERLERLRASGVRDWPAHFAAHSDQVAECAGLVRILEVNPATLRLFGVRDNSELMRGLPEFFVAESYPVFRDELVLLASGGTEFVAEIPVRDVHGFRRVLDLHLSVAPGHERLLDRVLVMCLDITERKRAEEALNASQEQYRLLAENISDVVFIIDFETSQLRYVSPSVERVSGFRVEELLGHDFTRHFTPESARRIAEVTPSRIAAFLRGETGSYTDELDQVRPDGSIDRTETTTRFVRNEKTGHIEIYGVTRRIQDRRRAEATPRPGADLGERAR